jgi:hypothetical protein
LEQASRTPKTRRATPESICDRQRRNRGIQWRLEPRHQDLSFGSFAQFIFCLQ